VAGRQKFIGGDPSGSRAKPLDSFDRPIDLLLTPGRLRNDPGYSAAMPGDDERLSRFYLVKQLREVDLGLRSLNFPHCGYLRPVAPTGRNEA
jgi:hypothetical protein